MKRLPFILSILAFFICCNISYSNVLFAKSPFIAEVTKIIDGDSLKVREGENVYEIRLYGIDAPEYDQPYSSMAKKIVKQSILRKKVVIEPVEWDRYHRLVAIVSYKDNTINEHLLEHGLAWYYPRYCKKSICQNWKKTESRAKRNKKNIWSDPSSVAPWTWKYNKHKKK